MNENMNIFFIIICHDVACLYCLTDKHVNAEYNAQCTGHSTVDKLGLNGLIAGFPGFHDHQIYYV